MLLRILKKSYNFSPQSTTFFLKLCFDLSVSDNHNFPTLPRSSSFQIWNLPIESQIQLLSFSRFRFQWLYLSWHLLSLEFPFLFLFAKEHFIGNSFFGYYLLAMEIWNANICSFCLILIQPNDKINRSKENSLIILYQSCRKDYRHAGKNHKSIWKPI